MHKFTKIAVTILLVISIVLYPFAPVLDIKASAIILEFIAPYIISMGIGTAEGMTFSMSQEFINIYGDDLTNAFGELHEGFLSSLDNLNQSGNAILIDPLNIDELKNAILKIYQDKEMQNKMSSNSYIKAQNLRIDNRVKRIIDFIKELM